MPGVTALVAAGLLAAAPIRPIVLYDFDTGIEGWWGNPWGGGECRVEPAPKPKFGAGALRVVFKGVTRGANGVAPLLPEQAEWRTGEWPYVSFWVRGQGEPCEVRFAVLGTTPDGKSFDFSRWFTVSGDRWQRCLIPVASFFQREGRPWDTARITRIVFGGIGTCHYDIDQFCLHPPTHFVPLEPIGDTGPAPLEPRLEHFADDGYELCFDPTILPAEEIHVATTVAWPGEQPVKFGSYMPGAGAKGEARVKLPGTPAAPGLARLELMIDERQGQVMYRGVFACRIVFGTPPKPPSVWQLVPQPKNFEFHARYGKPLAALLSPLPPADSRAGVDDPRDDMTEERWGEPPAAALAELKLRPINEAYLLDVGSDYLLARGRGVRGLRWARASLRQLEGAEALVSGHTRRPSATIEDWPSLPVRAVTLSLPNSRWGYPNDPPVDPTFFAEFLRDMVVELKLNFVVLMLDQGIKLEGHPEIAGPAAWPKETVLKLVQDLRAEGIEVAPLLNSLGHADWINASHPELREDGDLQTICTSHPVMKQVVGEIYGEVLRLLQPRYFHIGMDECRWQTYRVEEEKRCRLCAGKDKATVFADQVQWLHDFLAERGAKTMMWGDMLLPAHNGGPPFDVAQALPRIPRDIVMCDWSPAVDPFSLWYFRAARFERVLKSNSEGCSAADAPLVWGNMWGCWSKLPWLVENAVGYNSYNFLHLTQAAHYSWNLHPDVFHRVAFEPSFFHTRRLALARHVLRRCEPAGELYAWARAPQHVNAPLDESTAVASGKRDMLAAEALGGSKGKGLALVLALRTTPEQMTALRERLKDKTTWLGAPVAEVIFRYRDGATSVQTVNFGYHLRAAGSEGVPYVYAGVALSEEVGWYVVPIQNPRPEAELEAVILKCDPVVGTVHLAGARLFAEGS